MRSRQTSTGPDVCRPASVAWAGVPLFHAAWLFAGGIALSGAIWLRPSLVLIALAPIAVLCCIAAFRAQRIVWLPVAVLWILLGAWCAEMEPHPAPAPTIAALSDGLMRTVEGTVTNTAPLRNETVQNVDESTASAPAERIDLQVASIELVNDEVDKQVPASGSVRLNVRWPEGSTAEMIDCGERVRAVVRLLPPEIYHDPGVWNRADFLLDEGVTSTASVGIDRVERIGVVGNSADSAGWRSWKRRGVPLKCFFSRLQHNLSARLLALPAAMQRFPAPLRMSEADGVMLAAMTTGDRTFLTHSLRVGFERTGSFHMLVVSGFHLAIVAGCFFWMARRFRLPRVPATLLTIAASFGFGLLTGFGTPVQRSLWMVTLYLLGRLVYRERNAMNTIGFAALCLLAVSPRSLFDSSLQMTLLAVIAIAGVAAPLLAATVHPYSSATRDLQLVAIDVKLPARIAQFRVVLRMIAARLQRAASWRIGWRAFPWTVRFALRAAELLVVSCVVELAMTLPMATYFHRITVFALPVNVMIVPLLVVLMPAALLTLAALMIWPAAAAAPAMLVAALLHLGVWLVRLFGSFTFGDFRIPAPLAWQSAGFCVLLALAVILARGGAWPRRAAWAALLLAAFAAVVPRAIDHPHNALLVEAIDVGQGDSILLITPDGKTLLVDGGGFGGGPRQGAQDFDIGEEVVSPALWSRGIRHLDVVALSHAHSDHMGGLPAVLRNFHPDELWVGNNPPVAAYTALLDEAAELGVKVKSLRAGDTLKLGASHVHVLAPLADYRPGAEPANNDSLVLHVSNGSTSVMLEGDAEEPIEQAMLAEPGLESTLLKVGHHGSITSTRPEFLARVKPKWAVISCGLRNRYGHPREEVLQELQSAAVRTYSTDINGSACFELDGKNARTVDCRKGVTP